MWLPRHLRYCVFMVMRSFITQPKAGVRHVHNSLQEVKTYMEERETGLTWCGPGSGIPCQQEPKEDTKVSLAPGSSSSDKSMKKRDDCKSSIRCDAQCLPRSHSCRSCLCPSGHKSWFSLHLLQLSPSPIYAGSVCSTVCQGSSIFRLRLTDTECGHWLHWRLGGGWGRKSVHQWTPKLWWVQHHLLWHQFKGRFKQQTQHGSWGSESNAKKAQPGFDYFCQCFFSVAKCQALLKLGTFARNPDSLQQVMQQTSVLLCHPWKVECKTWAVSLAKNTRLL